MDNEYLAHHGIKGQKWGVRRFRNEDGTLTPAGKERYGNGSSESDRSEKRRAWFDQSVKMGKDKPNKSPAEVVTSESQKTVGNIRKSIISVRNIRNSRKSSGTSVKNFSDDELRKRVARLQLEKQYSDLSSNTISRGEYVVNNALDLTESMVGIAASAATVYAMLHMVKKAAGN